MIHIFFRFDDPSSLSDHELEKQIINLFNKYDSKICLAVIPFKARHKTSELAPLECRHTAHIMDGITEGSVEVFLHGFSHINQSNLTNRPSEFYGIPYEEQKDYIERGKDHLSDIFGATIKGFTPPFNTYDQSTLRALGETGFDYISAGWQYIEAIESESTHFCNIPRTCTLESFNNSIRQAQRFVELDPIVGVVLHHDEFEEHIHANDPANRTPFTNLTKLEDILRDIQANDIMTISHISEICRTRLGQKPLAHFNNWKWMNKTLPWRIRQHFPKDTIITGSKARIMLAAANSFLQHT